MHEFAGVTNLMAQPLQPEKAYFKDDGSFPNSGLPLLVYRQAWGINGWKAAWISA